jgi:hypothetical protein
MEAMTTSEDLRAIADRYWEARLEASPLFATFLGDHRYDDRVDDLSEQGEARQRQPRGSGSSPKPRPSTPTSSTRRTA